MASEKPSPTRPLIEEQYDTKFTEEPAVDKAVANFGLNIFHAGQDYQSKSEKWEGVLAEFPFAFPLMPNGLRENEHLAQVAIDSNPFVFATFDEALQGHRDLLDRAFDRGRPVHFAKMPDYFPNFDLMTPSPNEVQLMNSIFNAKPFTTKSKKDKESVPAAEKPSVVEPETIVSSENPPLFASYFAELGFATELTRNLEKKV